VSYDEFGDFDSPDPLVRFNAHAAAKGRTPMPDPDLVRKAEKERAHAPSGCTCGGRSICIVCCLAEYKGLLP
jgi:hypothetical protein